MNTNEKACEVKVVQERVYTAPVAGAVARRLRDQSRRNRRILAERRRGGDFCYGKCA